jgi:hypothetical protein
MFKKFSFLALLTMFVCSAVCADELDKSVLKDEWRDMVLEAVNWDHPGLERRKNAILLKTNSVLLPNLSNISGQKNSPKLC